MADLEELLLKRNVPGRYSGWDQEKDDFRHGRDDEHGNHHHHHVGDDVNDEYDGYAEEVFDIPGQNHGETGDIEDRVLNDDNIPDSIKYGILSERSQKHQTGVKGVLADHKASKALDAARREAKELEKQRILTRMVEGYKVPLAQQQQVLLPPTKHSSGDNEDDDDDEDDDEFMQAFRTKRLQEMKVLTQLPKFGQMKEISQNDFLTEIEEEDSRIYVIVHLYENGVSGSIRMNRILEEIAYEKVHWKILRMNASQNEIEVDRITLPIVTIYRAGETIDVLAGIVVSHGDYFTKEEVIWMLEEKMQGNT